MLMRILSAMLVVGALGTGCVSTEIRGSVTPEFRDAHFSKLMVYAEVKDNAWRDIVESSMAHAASSASLDVFRSTDLLTESRPYSDEETAQILAANGIDGLVRVKLEEWSSAVVEHPGVISAYHGPYGPVIVEHAPRRHESTRLIANIELVDRVTGKVAWRGQSYSHGGGYRDLEELARSAGSRLREHLYEQHLIGVR